MFLLGHLAPVEEISGVHARLCNLGYAAGAVTDSMTDELRTALRHFQRDCGIEETGEPDEATQEKLKEAHEC